MAPDLEKNSRPRVLLVEDDMDEQALLRRILEGSGFDVFAANDGGEALFSMVDRNFDLILLDINMPSLNGFQFMDSLNQKGVTTPVIFITSETDQEYEVRGLKMGAADFIRKPVQRDVLAERVVRAISRP